MNESINVKKICKHHKSHIKKKNQIVSKKIMQYLI